LGLFPRNFCIKTLYIQSINDLIIFDINKAVKLNYKDLSSKDKKQYPIFWNQKTPVLPFAIGLKLTDNGYQYTV
jgi:hypothetical protein